MRYINHKSDFQVIINITDKDGNIIAPPSVQWEAVFSDENGCEFTCYYDGTNYTHCIVDGNDIVCFVDNPGFSCGKLRCTFCQHVPSKEYCDGVMDLSQPLQCDIMLSKRESDDSTPITIEASPNWVRGEQGIQGIQGEKGTDGFSPIVSLTKQGAISTLSITDANGEHTTEIADGAKGDDGFSPIVSLNKVDKVTTLTITDAQGTHTATVNDGESMEIVQSTGESTTAVMSQKAVSDKLSELEDDIEVVVENNITPNVIEGLAVKNSNLVKADATKKTFYIQGKEGQSITIYFADITDTTSFYFGFADGIPVAELPITGYKTSNPSDTLRKLVFPRDCYLLVSCSKTNSCYYIEKKTEGIGFDVYNLKHTINESKENAEFSVEGKGIWYEDDSRYKGGSDIIASSNKATSFIKLGNAKSIVFKLTQFERSTFAAVAYYDKDKNYLGGLKGYDGNTEVTISALEFPSGAFYVRFSSEWVEGRYAIVYYDGNAIDGLKKDIKDINTALANYDNEFKYWAACGDSITHANHKCMTPLAGDDPYNPIDDYQGRGYDAYISGNYPNYAYLYCKKHHIKWANYGFGGTIIGSYVPIGETILYPFVEDRINQFKDGVDWNYISLFFGWNDRVHGVQYYREKWLKDTYGTAIKYTTESSKYGTSGYCTESQRIACDNATEMIDGVSYTGYDLFFMKFIGNINDTTKYTYYGAYNYAVDYLMRKFPKAKIMLITPYIGGVNRMYYQKMRQAIIDVAEKFGITYFDFGSLPYWYFTNMIQTPFANPDRDDGKWYKDSWTPEEPELRLCNPTIEGFHQHLYCYDSVHPTNLGYEMIAEPIGNMLMNG